MERSRPDRQSRVEDRSDDMDVSGAGLQASSSDTEQKSPASIEITVGASQSTLEPEATQSSVGTEDMGPDTSTEPAPVQAPGKPSLVAGVSSQAQVPPIPMERSSHAVDVASQTAASVSQAVGVGSQTAENPNVVPHRAEGKVTPGECW